MILNSEDQPGNFLIYFQEVAFFSTDQHVLFHRIYPEEKHPGFFKDVRATAD
ncbi:hypothetical protein TBC1_117 [Lentimicrobium saccharophilum]|uniref:Uncharacterized protein n=1 Tax=Lentimicrobium saccharophilum TaxID=1678841 RepID=A0A0S7BYS6_9BACT|nr:hypothetical protein [Lentimicrobium saccharophilum]GAP41881.1 hypothetical protein TBC1_117 [Lentimicrobium saccharophilum]